MFNINSNYIDNYDKGVYTNMMFKKKKKIKASREDKDAIKYLRQRILTNEQQLNLNIIDEEEFEKELKDIVKEILRLENKYGLD